MRRLALLLPPEPRLGILARLRLYLWRVRFWRTPFYWVPRNRALARIRARRLARTSALLLLLLPGCALLRSPASQTTPTSANGARVVVVVFALWAPHVVGIDLSGPVAGQAGPQSAEQSTKVDAKADVKVPVVP